MHRMRVGFALPLLCLALGCTTPDRSNGSEVIAWRLVDWPSVEVAPLPEAAARAQTVELGATPPSNVHTRSRAIIDDNHRYTFLRPESTFVYRNETFIVPPDSFPVDVGLPGELTNCETLKTEITMTSAKTSIVQHLVGRCTGLRGAEHLQVEVPSPPPLRGESVDFWVHAQRIVPDGIRQRRFLIPQVPSGARFAFSYGVETPGWVRDASAATFHVLVEGRPEPLFSARLDPALNETQRRWFEASVDLSRYAGKRLPLILQLALDRADDRRPFSEPVWGNPRILVPRTGKRAPNVLLITIDTLRADRLHCYGYEQGHTPNIDRLAAEGARFANAFCDVSWTAPSLASTMTGKYAVAHGLKSTYQRLGVEHHTLATILRNRGYLAGYTTGAIVGSFPASSMFGFGQGFDIFDEHFNTPIVTGAHAAGHPLPLTFHNDIEEQKAVHAAAAANNGYRPDNEVTDAALAWLRTRHTDRFFLWVHYFGPHEKSDKSRSFYEDINHAIASYDGDIETSDREVGRLIDGLRATGILDSTVVVLHADHGQSLNEHSYFGHGKYLYDEVLRIPLIMRFPSVISPGRVITGMARNIDIVPTVLELIGATTDSPLQGKSLVPAMRADGANRDGDELYCETYLSATEAFATQVPLGEWHKPLGFRRLGIRSGQWMFIRNEPWPFIDEAHPPPIDPDLGARFTSEELYDVAADPGEGADLHEREPQTLDRMRARLDSYLAMEQQPASYRPLDKESLDRLRSLGYVR